MAIPCSGTVWSVSFFILILFPTLKTGVILGSGLLGQVGVRILRILEFVLSINPLFISTPLTAEQAAADWARFRVTRSVPQLSKSLLTTEWACLSDLQAQSMVTLSKCPLFFSSNKNQIEAYIWAIPDSSLWEWERAGPPCHYLVISSTWVSGAHPGRNSGLSLPLPLTLPLWVPFMPLRTPISFSLHILQCAVIIHWSLCARCCALGDDTEHSLVDHLRELAVQWGRQEW